MLSNPFSFPLPLSTNKEHSMITTVILLSSSIRQIWFSPFVPCLQVQVFLTHLQRHIVAVIHVQRKFGIPLLLIQLVALLVEAGSHGFRQTEDIVNGMLAFELVMSFLMVLAALYVIQPSVMLLHRPLRHPRPLHQRLFHLHLHLQIKSVVVLLIFRLIQVSNVRTLFGILLMIVLCFALPTEELPIHVT